MLTTMILAAATATVDPGPAPDRSIAIAQAEAEVRSRLIDPDSAQFSWPYDFAFLTMKGLFTRRVTGWTTCGTVNSRNRMGGYAGASAVMVTFASGQIVALNVGESTTFDAVGAQCEDAIKKGLLHAVLPAPAATASEIAKRGSIGIAYSPSPFGAMIMAVAPGSPAERAGLRPGETIEAANGVSLKGMDTAAAGAVFNGLGSNFTLTVVGVGEIKVTR